MSIGIHIAKKSHVLEGVKRNKMRDAIKQEVELLNLSAIQIFVIGPQNRQKNAMSHQEIKKYCDEHNIAVYVHSSYMATEIWSVRKEIMAGAPRPTMEGRRYRGHIIPEGEPLPVPGIGQNELINEFGQLDLEAYAAFDSEDSGDEGAKEIVKEMKKLALDKVEFKEGDVLPTGGKIKKDKHKYWDKSVPDLNKSKRLFRDVKDHVVLCRQLGARGLVIHLTKNSPQAFVDALKIMSIKKEFRTLREGGLKFKEGSETPIPFTPILLEMPAMTPGEMTFETPEKLNRLCAAFEAEEADIKVPWGLCIDTSHLWAGGIDFAKPNSWDLWLGDLTDYTRARIKLIHLNGASDLTFNTGKDKHIIPFSAADGIWGGYISKEFRAYLHTLKSKPLESLTFDISAELSARELDDVKQSSLYHIVRFCVRHNVDMICEINRGDYVDAKFAIDLINRFRI